MSDLTINSNLYCVVMAGGQGTRFWPESTSKKPKQYLALAGKNSLLTETLMRFEGLIPSERRFIVTVKAQEKLAEDAAKGLIGKDGLIFEPSGRNTAPCILLSLAALLEQGASVNDVVAIVPSDHVILNTKGFQETIKKAAELAVSKDHIVTIGIKPNFPHTGFGYIHQGDEVAAESYHVAEFKEKPNSETATKYVASGEYFWNAGMFMGKIGVLISEFEEYAPDTAKFLRPLQEGIKDFKQTEITYSQIPKDSIDYAIMEKSKKIMVVAAQFDWNDLGSWDALEAIIDPVAENTIAAARDCYIQNAKGNIIFAPNKHVSLINVDDLIVVANDKTVVVLPKKDSQEVKKIVAALQGTDLGKDLL